MVDLYGQYFKIKDEVNEAIQEVMDSSAFIKGPAVKNFETKLAEFCSVEHVVSCGNGTDALQIAMMALDFKAGDEVILPVHTYVATAEVIVLLGLKPVFVDVDPHTFNIDTTQIESKITDKTVAIVPVHLYGQCADMEALLKISKKYELKVIEDTAQALGALYTFSDGTVKQAGTMGDIGTTSFFPSKNLGCFGDGGALMINDASLTEKSRMIANHGQQKKYHHDVIGVNSRLDTMQAAILNVKLKYLNDYTLKRQQAASYYNEKLSEVEFLNTPYVASNSTHVYHQYTLTTEGIDRDEFKKYLADHGIPSMIYYPVPLHHQKAYKHLSSESFSVAEALSKTVISLPIHTEMDHEIQDIIIDKIKSF
ncbi:DegT/DnrJ/EryC1/StrS family aminotransferase [Fulvivirga sp. 29W222]|uniref:DegT/DnrJ/EryC1/StrS family aminotransferase n=2 Tax=Fulvivirga marina TaxID=2494733 RepID=A0A937G1A5_9BACT|nr:DegT/DnrJ/EryC1/StrS family aminotransferase [Fulvivirga marina]